MSQGPELEPCPYCRELISVRAHRCRYCGREVGDDDYQDVRPRRRPRNPGMQATDFLVPVNVSGWALASCYLGLIGFCLPFVGIPFGLVAVFCGIMAFQRKKQRAVTYGDVTGNVRAVIGLILGSLAVVGWGAVLVIMLATHGIP